MVDSPLKDRKEVEVLVVAAVAAAGRTNAPDATSFSHCVNQKTGKGLLALMSCRHSARSKHNSAQALKKSRRRQGHSSLRACHQH